MAILTIYSDYTVSQDKTVVPQSEGFLVIAGPSCGCVICVEPELDKESNPVTIWDAKRKARGLMFIDFTGKEVDTSWTYRVYPKGTDDCRPDAAKLAAHTIQIGN